MSRFRDALLDLLFPPRCPFCRKLLKGEEREFCAACQHDLPWLQGRKAEWTGEFVRLCVSPLRYEGRVRESFHRYKFEGRRGYAGLYGKLMAQCVADHLKGQYDLITWVPLSEKRRKQRGYDQSQLLARMAAEALGDQAADTLRKRRDTQAQSRLGDASARRANVLGNYELMPGASVAGKRVLLVDDVVTTGATLSECARVLRTAGAADVVCVTLAKTVKRTGEQKNRG